MDLVIALEQRFSRTRDGAVWTDTTYEHAFWTRYLGVFDRVRVLARVRDVERGEAGWRRVDGERVSLAAVPHYLGPRDYLRRYRAVRDAVHATIAPGSAVILRLPGTLGMLAARRLRGNRYPFGAEVGTDPYDMFAPGAVRHPLRPVFRWWFARELRRECEQATSTLYVTEAALQRRYPPAAGAVGAQAADPGRDAPCGAGAPPPYTTGVSDVELPECAFVDAPREGRHDRTGPFRVICVGTLAQLYKGQDVLIDAGARCVRAGLDIEVVLVGDGGLRPTLEALAARLGMHDRVRFAGHLPAGDSVRDEVDRADLFVLASRQEGLPRAMVEAMARAVPCVGTGVGGIPELLPEWALVPCDDADKLAQKIAELAADPALWSRLSAHSLDTARRYSEARLQARRAAFYRSVVWQTQCWLSAPRPSRVRPRD